MTDNLKLLRYNTGTDKKVLVKFKDHFSAVVFNATIVAYSKSAVADLVAVHKNKYIIDPQTHIYQQDIKAVQTESKAGQLVIKKSIDQYLSELPLKLKNEFISSGGKLSSRVIFDSLDELVDCVYDFSSNYVNKYIAKKEYDKYLSFANVGPSPAAIIAPYFMLKSSYSEEEIDKWLELNCVCAEKTIEKNRDKYFIGIQIVLDKGVLEQQKIVEKIKQYYRQVKAKYAFVWIDDFNIFDATVLQQKQFKALLEALTEIELKPVMAYGGYDAIILCNKDLPYRMYGVAQSVGYGETRPVTPVGGGLPVNKYYFLPLHSRLPLGNVISILTNEGYFSTDKKRASELFYEHICSCKQCRDIIVEDINNFKKYNESSDYTMRNGIKRNRPTSDASLIAAFHFMHSKIREWKDVENLPFDELKKELLDGYAKYYPSQIQHLQDWCRIYE